MHRVVFFISLVVLLFLIFFFFTYYRFSDKKLHIVFCDVGQGDAIFIRTPSGKAVLVDGGPGEKVLDCLASHMPFWQRHIDVMLLTHPHADHLNGLNDVLDGYSVSYFATEALENATAGYKHLVESVQRYGVNTRHVFAGDKITVGDGVVLSIVGPSKQFLTKTSPNGTIGESSEFGSLIVMVSYGEFDVLLTGDSQVEGMLEAVKGDAFYRRGVEVLQAPHHGSRFGLDKTLVKAINPKLAVISVGKNKYGHPTPFTLSLLKEGKIPYLRTDQKGDIEVISDGKKWGIKE